MANERNRQPQDWRQTVQAWFPRRAIHRGDWALVDEVADFDTRPTAPQQARPTEGPYRGVGPRGYQRREESIEADINDRLTAHGYLDASDITVQVTRGEVTLTGTVDSRRAKVLAEDLAESVSGVVDVHNRLRIRAKDETGRG